MGIDSHYPIIHVKFQCFVTLHFTDVSVLSLFGFIISINAINLLYPLMTGSTNYKMSCFNHFHSFFSLI
jgi:hypothetical protein